MISGLFGINATRLEPGWPDCHERDAHAISGAGRLSYKSSAALSA
jgi:hypothetical protein